MAKVNIIKDIVTDLCERLIALRFDICKCEVCKNKMVEQAVDKFPVHEIDDNDPDYRVTFIKLTNQYFIRIITEVTQAIEYITKNPPHQINENRESGFKELLDRIYQDRGMDFSQYHHKILKRRVVLRLRANQLNSYGEYLKLLARDEVEYEKLFDTLTINVTEFFRDLPIWNGISAALERLAKEKKPNETIKIWSAACSSGEEPYSVAIVLKELGLSNSIEIHGSDIDRESMIRAQVGLYDVSRLKNVSKTFLKRYFVPASDGKYLLNEEIKKMVSIKKTDLINDEFLTNIDFILCRNVFIYFTRALQEQILNKFYHALRNGGYLVIGTSETILSEAKLIFKDIDIDNRIYQKVKIDSV